MGLEIKIETIYDFSLVTIAGIMGLMGVELKISTAIIFTIAFGIAVDDTIHFLGKYKFELMKGKSPLYALKRSYLTTGKAMILTTLILCSYSYQSIQPNPSIGNPFFRIDPVSS